MKRLIPLVFILCGVLGFSQNFQDKIPKAQAITPDAASLFKVIDRPIGTFTGTQPVNFPLARLTSGALSANVSLNYNSLGGIKVEEQASSVGLGFSLDQGSGRIVQIVNDAPDDSSIGLLNYPLKPSNFDCNDMIDVHAAWEEYGVDLEPDIFMYHLNGESGRFFFQEDGTIVMMQKTGIRIEYTPPTPMEGSIRQWIITDEEGNKYYFGRNKDGTQNYYLVNDYTYSSQNSSGTSTGPSSYSWYLTEAYDINQENKITYSYVLSDGIMQNFSGGFMRLYTLFSSGGPCDGYDVEPDYAMVSTGAAEYLVSRIETLDGAIELNSSSGRLDSRSGRMRKVDNLQLFDNRNVLIKEYDFNYDYFNEWSNDPDVKRLKLTGFSEKYPGSTESHDHSFEYYESQNMPSRLSPRVDFWGFYNGTYNTSFFPNVVFKHGSTEIRRNNLGNKNANGSYGKTNVLRKIQYPTGGYREFIHEPNTALTTFNPNIYHPDPSNSTTRGFARNDFDLEFDPYPSLTQFFTVNSNDGGARFDYNAITLYQCNGFHVKLFKVDQEGQYYGGIEIFDVYSNNFQQNLLNGVYRLEVYIPSPSCTVTEIYGFWTEMTFSLGTIQTPYGTFNENNREVGGVRLKEIRDYDPLTDSFNRTEYKYKLYSTDSTKTSGVLISQPNLVSIENIPGVECLYYKMTPESSYPLASQEGSYVVYPEVRTIEHGNGWRDRVYSFAADEPPYSFPYIPPYDLSAYRGQLLEEKVYNDNGDLLRRTSNRYTHYGGQNIQGAYKVKAYFHRGMFPPPTENHYWSEFPFAQNQLPSLGACNWYALVGDAFDIEQTIDSTFTADGVIVTRTDYEYDFDYNDRLLLKRIKQRLNNGTIATKTYNYSYTSDNQFVFGAPSTIIKTALLDKNHLQPLEVRDSVYTASGTDLLIGGSKLVYSSSSGIIRLQEMLRFKETTKVEQINFSRYGPAGQLQEQYKDNGIKEVYLWGYGNLYPVAKVVGSDYDTVAALVDHNILQNPPSDQALRSELNKIRTQLAPNPVQVWTYTFDPLVGMTSMTDPRGMTTHYKYDHHNRLEFILDEQGELLEEYKYHYKEFN